jgi:acetyl-CoA C-acetyltransferase
MTAGIAFERAAIPLGLAWSSPFCRWQGPLAAVSSLELAVDVTARALADRGVEPSSLAQLVLGWTVPQPGIFYGAPTVAARLGAPALTGPMISQACATSVACLAAAAATVEAGLGGPVLVVAADRTSNGPHLVYPRPDAPGAAPLAEDWVLDNFRRDPWAGESMVATAEAVAAEAGMSRAEIDETTLLRHEQYRAALVDDRVRQREFMVPATAPGRPEPLVVEADSGVHETSAEGLAALAPLVPGGVVTYGSQTHPADGAAGAIITTLEGEGGGGARLLAAGFARVEPARMPRAPVPAALAALAACGLGLDDVHAVTTHNPFTVSDLWFARETGWPVERMNELGSSLVYGHPQGPTGLRAIVELMATLTARGGGVGLFTGCAAGDTGGALVLRVDD